MRYYRGLIIISMLFITSCGEKEEIKKEVLRPVKSEVADLDNGGMTRSFTGNVKAGNEIELSFRSSGILTVMNAEVGKEVKKGDLIAQLDNLQAQLAYEQSLSAVNSAKSALNTAESTLNRVRTLFEKGSKSLADYENAKNQFEAAKDNYESALRNKGIQSSQVSYGVIRSPENGIIASTGPGLNENVSAGTVVAVLNAGDELNIEVGLPENVVDKMSLGKEVAIEISSIGKNYKGVVYEISPVPEENSATYPVKVSIQNPDAEVRPGMSTQITVDLRSDEEMKSQAIIVPVIAVGEDSDGNFVFVIEEQGENIGVVSKRPVKVGELSSQGFEVISGLKTGERYATAGLQTLLDGQKVKLQ